MISPLQISTKKNTYKNRELLFYKYLFDSPLYEHKIIVKVYKKNAEAL